MTIDIENSSADEPKEKENEGVESTVEGVKDTVQALTEDEIIAQRKAFLQTSIFDVINVKKSPTPTALKESLMKDGIYTVADILSKTVQEALEIDYIGANSFYLIADRAQKLGLSFSGVSLQQPQGDIEIADILKNFPAKKIKKSKIMRYLESEIKSNPKITVRDVYDRKLSEIAEEIRSRKIHYNYIQWPNIVLDLVEIYTHMGVCILDAGSRLAEKKR